MIQPNEVKPNHSHFGPGSPVKLRSKAGGLQCCARGRAKARRCPALIGILWVMNLPLAVACLVGCTGFASPPKSPTALSAAPTSPSVTSLRITTAALPVGAVQSSYTATLTATGGVPPYTWTTSSGQLPAGLRLNMATGAITGIPTWAGSFSFTTRVRDARAESVSSGFSLNISTELAPTIATLSPNSGTTEGGTPVTISGSNFRSGAVVHFGGYRASTIEVGNAGEIHAVTPVESAGQVNVTVQDSDGQITIAPKVFTFVDPAPKAPAEPTASADVVVDGSKTVSETGTDDLTAAKNIFASASSPESNGGLSDWDLISSEFTMKRMRIINGLGDCELDANGNLTGCSRLNDNLTHVKERNLTPHVIVGQWAPSSIEGNPLQWGAAQWARYDALSYAIVNYVVNQYAGTGFSEALFEVGNELDITQSPQDLWLSTTPNVPQGDPSRFTQYDTVYSHWANAVSRVAQQNLAKKIRIAGPATGFWTAGMGWVWQNRIIQKYASKGVKLDVVSLHEYGANVTDLAKYAQSVRSTLNASGNSKAEIWVTEWGGSSSGDNYFGAINASHQGAAWAINFLLQALKGTVTGGSFLAIRDNSGTDVAGANSNIDLASWLHVLNSVEYPKPISNAFSAVSHMTGTRKSAAVTASKPDLCAMASSDSSSASLIVANYNYLFDYNGKNFSDLTRNENVTVAFENLPFSGPVTVDRYLVDAKNSNLYYWVAAGKVPPSVQITQLQKVESFPAAANGGVLALPARQLGPSAVSLWIVHQ
jgi:hypothetical protein